ncbi:MAG: hypothetical protein D6677_05475 [Calditrichaeota bacterium]|nr:MAG: hypothetical protein D6677_05475 [Calditrichota bacterium]
MKENHQRTRLTIQEKRHYVYLRRRFNGPVIGITGYLGKTTLSEMLTTVLSERGKVLRTPHGKGSWNNNLKTLQRLSADYDYAIFEFDSYSGKDFAGLLRLIKPNIGVVTNIGDAHLSYLDDAMRLALERSAVVKYLARSGTAVLNHDDDLSTSLSQFITDATVLKFGLNQASDYFATHIEQRGPDGLSFKLNGQKEVRLPLYSVSDIYAFLATCAVLTPLDITVDTIVSVLRERFTMPKGRGNLERINGIYLLDESFHGSSRAVSKAARSLIGFKPHASRLIFIVGDMHGTGVNVADRHLNMGHFLAALPFDYLITLGHYARFIGEGARLIPAPDREVVHVDDVNQLLAYLKQIVRPNAAIAVKGLGNVVFHRIRSILKTIG